MEDQTKEQLLRRFDREHQKYRDLCESMAALLRQVLENEGIPFHSITHRAKGRSSLESKLQRPDKQYADLEEVTDLAGVRVTSYFASDVDRIAMVVEREFTADRPNSVDKRATLDPDRFGYLSLHYVVSLSENRLTLAEYARHGTQKFELQLRSILQHAWAEIEHDLGYKSKAGVPREVQRKFARVASLLELADKEFDEIRRELASYALSLASAIEETPRDVTVDKLSLLAYIRNNPTAQELDRASSAVFKAELVEPGDAFVDHLVNEMKWLGLTTIAQVDEAMKEFRPIAERFLAKLFERLRSKRLDRGIGLAHAGYALLAERGEAALVDYLDHFRIAGPEDRPAFLARVLEAYANARRD
jgi:putative GTP pyrophosphokinase